MKLPLLFRRQPTVIQRADAQDRLEKAMAESLRLVGQVCTKVADLIETQRLSRAGYSQGTLLHRVDTPEKKDTQREPE